MRPANILRRFVWAWEVILCVAGCNGPSDRFVIRGTVTLDGKGIPKGSIAFRPLESARSPSAGAEIVDGQFSIPAEKGVRPGQFRVEIIATRKTGKSIKDPVFGPTDVEVQYLPPRYNIRSELTADITADKADELNFELKSN